MPEKLEVEAASVSSLTSLHATQSQQGRSAYWHRERGENSLGNPFEGKLKKTSIIELQTL